MLEAVLRELWQAKKEPPLRRVGPSMSEVCHSVDVMRSTNYPRPGRRVRRDAPLTRTLGIRVADDEAQAITAAAEAEGKSVAQWLRGTAISASAAYTDRAPVTGGAAVPDTISASAVDPG